MASPAPAMYTDLTRGTTVASSSCSEQYPFAHWNNRLLIAVLGITIGTGGAVNASPVANAPTSSQIQLTVCNLKEMSPANESLLLAHEQIAGIQRYLSMNVTDLAKAMRIARPTVYAWMKGARPHEANLERISHLYRISRTWRSMSSTPVGRYLTVPLEGGLSLIEQLSQEELSVAAISDSLARIKSAMKSGPRRQTIQETAQERGLQLLRGKEKKSWSADDNFNL